MAPNPKSGGFWSRVHFGFRLLGLVGLAVSWSSIPPNKIPVISKKKHITT